MTKKNILKTSVLIFVSGCIFLTGCNPKSDTIKGTFKPSENIGEIEIKKDGQVNFKKLGIQGKAVVDGDKIAVNCGIVTYYFTRQSDGTLVEGITEPSEKLTQPNSSIYSETTNAYPSMASEMEQPLPMDPKTAPDSKASPDQTAK